MILRNTLFLLFFGLSFQFIAAQGLTCGTPHQVCPDANGYFEYPFTAGATDTAGPGNDYGCLSAQPNPRWFQWRTTGFGRPIFKVSNSQSLSIQYAIYGPFTSLQSVADTCGRLDAPVLCSNSESPVQYLSFPPSAPGQLYLVLITKNSNVGTDLFFEAVHDASVFDCNIALPGCGLVNEDPPGCTICKPVYHGQTATYSACCTQTPGFCGSIENNQWLNFKASDTTAVINFYAANCLNGAGIEAIVYDTLFNPVSNCFSSNGRTMSGQLRAEGLTPGTPYYIMIDGYEGDVCAFTLYFENGVRVGPPDAAPVPDGPSRVCPGGSAVYSVPEVVGASDYHWIVPKDFAKIIAGQNTREIVVEFTGIGSGEICVCPTNACYEGAVGCRSLLAEEIPTTILADTVFCSTDFPVVMQGISLDTAGTYTSTLMSKLGCDSSVQFTVIEDLNCRPSVNLTEGVIKGDSIVCFGNTAEIFYDGDSMNLDWTFGNIQVLSGTDAGPYILSFDEPGIYKLKVTVSDGEDSLAYYHTIRVVAPPEKPVAECIDGDVPGSMTICLDDGGFGTVTSYQIRGIFGTVGQQTGNCFEVQKIRVPDGNAYIEVTTSGLSPCPERTDTLFCSPVVCPPVQLVLDPVVPMCVDATTGDIPLTANVTGGAGGGTGTWSGPGVLPGGIFSPQSAGVGTHEVVYTYVEGDCEWESTMEIVIAGPPVIEEVSLRPPLFLIQNKGDIELTMAGNGPFFYQWTTIDGQFVSNNEDLAGVPPGQYCVRITSPYGCVTEACYSISYPVFRVLPVHVICRGRSAALNVRPSNGVVFQWSNAGSLSCDDCANPTATPDQSTVYTVNVQLPDGRTGSMNIFVIVLPDQFCPFTSRLASESEARQKFIQQELERLDAPENSVQIFNAETEITVSGKYRIFPNPFEHQLYVETMDQKINWIRIFDTSGRLLWEQKGNSENNLINLGFLKKGTYILKIQSDKGVQIEKIVKI